MFEMLQSTSLKAFSLILRQKSPLQLQQHIVSFPNDILYVFKEIYLYIKVRNKVCFTHIFILII